MWSWDSDGKITQENQRKRRLYGQSDPLMFNNTALLNNHNENKLKNLPLLIADKINRLVNTKCTPSMHCAVINFEYEYVPICGLN